MNLNTKEIANYSYLIVILFLPFLYFLIKQFTSSPTSKSRPLPPGPRPWPILGNLPQMRGNPHLKLSQFANIYGPIFSLRLGTQFLVIASSQEAASEILKTQDRVLSGRYLPDMLPVKWLKLDNKSILWARECNEDHRYMRSFSQTWLFSSKAVALQSSIREGKVKELASFVEKLEGKVLKVKEVALITIFGMLSNILMSRDLVSLENESLEGGLNETIRIGLELDASPNVSDVYPMLAPLDLQGRRKMGKELYEILKSLWMPVVEDKRKGKRSDDHKDFVDMLIEDGCSDEEISILLEEILFAGTDASSSTIEWTLTELMKNRECLKEVQEELAREIKSDTIQESNIPKLKFLHACIKESMRLHPAVPLLIPHRATDSCVVMNYTVPKNSQVIVNIWAIGRDPNIWEDPLVYKPDRFFNNSVDFEGNVLEFIPFGLGRRACPGRLMAWKQVSLTLATLIHFFDLSLPSGSCVEDIDQEEVFHVTMPKKQPLHLVAKAKI